jgi:hypothetical protein
MKDTRNKFLASVEKLFERKQFKNLKELLSAMEPADIAEVPAEKAPAERVFLFRLLPKDLAIEVFEFLEGTEREELLGSFTDSEAAGIIEEMSDYRPGRSGEDHVEIRPPDRPRGRQGTPPRGHTHFRRHSGHRPRGGHRGLRAYGRVSPQWTKATWTRGS